MYYDGQLPCGNPFWLETASRSHPRTRLHHAQDMSVRKKPTKKEKAFLLVEVRNPQHVDRDHIVPRPRSELLDYVAFQRTMTLTTDDPDKFLISHKLRYIWSYTWKSIILECLMGYLVEHEGPKPVSSYLPTEDKPWFEKDKALAVLCMRAFLGPNWRHQVARFILEDI